MEKLTKQVLRELNEAYLTKYVKEEPKYNPLDILRTEDNLEFEKKIVWLLSQPEYFAFLCKHILNVDILPFQNVILQELWVRKYPMLIGSRGSSKSFMLALYSLIRALIMPNRRILVAGAAFRQSKFIHEYMETIWKNAPILRDLVDQDSGPSRSPDMCKFVINGSTVTCIPIGTGEKIRGYRCQDLLIEEFSCLSRNSLVQTDLGLIKISDYLDGNAHSLMNIDGEFEYPDQIFMTPPVDVYRVTTYYGFSFECSEIHQVMTNNGWKRAIDLTPKDHISLGKNDYFPSEYIIEDGILLDEDMGWLLGLLISEGCVTNRNNFSLVNTDRRLIDSIKDRIKFDWRESTKEAHINERGWDCKTAWTLRCDDTELRSTMRKFGLDYDISLNKEIPSAILRSPKSVVLEFLNGMYEGDGSALYTKSSLYRDEKEFQVVLYSSSKKLLEVTQLLLLKLGVYSAINARDKGFKNTNYVLRTRGANAANLYKMLTVIKWDFDKEALPNDIPRKPVIRKNGDRFIVSTNLCSKGKHIGTFDTEEECIVAFDEFWKGRQEFLKITSVEKLSKKEVLYDFHLPKTHSFVANGFLQHNSHSREIFETVLAGFGNVSAAPADVVRRRAAEEMASSRGIDPLLLGASDLAMGNQIILCGTAFYDFNHFADYWKKYKQIINSRGDSRRVREIFPEGVPDGFNWKDYSVIRLPYEALPKGFMDEGNVARSKASVHSGIFMMEWQAIFVTDSNGFFKRSLIESCVTNEHNEVTLPSGPVVFDAMVKGSPSSRYIIGVDPASEIDNFSIVVLELHNNHRRIVHCWTTTRQSHSERVKLGLTTEDNFYSYAARKIRELVRVFPTERIMLDSQGGGIAVNEALHETSNLHPGEVPFWPIVEENKEKPTDDEVGLHIIELVNFAKAEWTSEANHGLRKDFEDKALLFPKFDPVVLGLAAEQDKINNKLYDTLEDCVMEIEEMKNELVLIEITKTPNGRDRWDTPDIKVGANKKRKMRKDRYSALLMANMGARNFSLAEQVAYESYGGFSSGAVGRKAKLAYIAPPWFKSAQDAYDGY